MIQTANRIANVEEYYFSKKLAEVRRLDTPDKKVINLGIGSPDMPPSAETIGTLSKVAARPDSHGYQSYKGVPDLRNAIAAFYKRTYGVSLNAETEILPLMGSKEGIMHVAMAFVNEGDEVLIPNPGYPTYASVAKLTGANITTYDLNEEADWGVDIESIRKRDLSKVKLMWVNFPHMPTGRVASRTELEALVQLAREHNFLIVNDNPYSLILNDAPLSILSIEGAREVALELNSLSKSHNMAGWRIGWVAGNKEYIDAVLRVKSNMDSGMFLGLQQAAVTALENGPGWFQKLNEIYMKRKSVACRILDALGCTYSPKQSGLFVWAKAPQHVPNIELWIDELLYGAYVFIAPGFIFGDAGNRFIRISLCAPVEKLDEAYKRILDFLNERKLIKENSNPVDR
jgi:LL-diaminopimelate aminotransferase